MDIANQILDMSNWILANKKHVAWVKLSISIVVVLFLTSCAHPLREFGIRSNDIRFSDSLPSSYQLPRLVGFFQGNPITLEKPIRICGGSMDVKRLAALIHDQGMNSPESLIVDDGDSVIVFYRNFMDLDSDIYSDASLVFFVSYRNGFVSVVNSYAVSFCSSSPRAYLHGFSSIQVHDSGYIIKVNSDEFKHSYGFSIEYRSGQYDVNFEKYNLSRNRIAKLSGDKWLFLKVLLGLY